MLIRTTDITRRAMCRYTVRGRRQTSGLKSVVHAALVAIHIPLWVGPNVAGEGSDAVIVDRVSHSACAGWNPVNVLVNAVARRPWRARRNDGVLSSRIVNLSSP